MARPAASRSRRSPSHHRSIHRPDPPSRQTSAGTIAAPAMTDEAALEPLFAELEAAVRDKDRDRALELESAISQRLAANAAETAAMERRLRALMVQLDAPADTPHISIESKDFERPE